MIDFRYHLVSLVAVFMALAVGIVLGAGPLGQEISSTLEGQVKDLREERNGLRAQLDQAHDREQLKDQAFAIATPTLTANQLTDRRVAIITLPGADRNIVGQVHDQLTSAGAAVVLTVRLDDAWHDPEAADTRHEAAAELAPEVDDPEPREGAEPTLETVMAAALAGRDEGTASGAWRMASDRLEELNFYSTNWADSEPSDFPEPPDTFVVVTGDLKVQQVEEDEAGAPRLQQSLGLIAALGELEVPTLVAGSGTESYADPVQAAESPVVRGLRAESAMAETVASVDNAEGPAGQLAVVLGLRWMIDGEAGHWGVGTDAVAPLPNIPEPPAAEDEESVPGPTLPLEPTLPGSGEESGSPGSGGDGSGGDGSGGDETGAGESSGAEPGGAEGSAPADEQTTPVGPLAPAPPDDAESTTGAPAP
ncbi:copper transporter [Ornithinimicrobium faecis]|uniref:Copper transporter n=1 Tax=Ornithinimicrobium faecis TaxID=2934158 RepID=A0ABY4YP36_9MICO|nr:MULTISPECIES: copper transporter [unclassified Ornithinimicrobium]USQ78377.1 copper transporter [Ornithinimicrobium sp. HY1793]